MINIQKITLKFKFQYYRRYTYIWKEEKNATILNLNVTCYMSSMEWDIHFFLNTWIYSNQSTNNYGIFSSQKKKKLWYI